MKTNADSWCWLLIGVILGGAGMVLLLGRPREGRAANDRSRRPHPLHRRGHGDPARAHRRRLAARLPGRQAAGHPDRPQPGQDHRLGRGRSGQGVRPAAPRKTCIS